jgi:hypothetical protein
VAAILYFFNPWAHDGKAYSTRVLLDFPLFFSLFCVFFWLLGGWLIARFGGWDDLAKAYGSEQLYEGSYLRWRSAKLNHIHYHTCLDLGADSEGLHLSMNYLFKVHHRDLFIPWAEIKASRSQMIWGPTIVLQFEKVPKVSLEFHEKTISALKEMANTSVAFKDLT